MGEDVDWAKESLFKSEARLFNNNYYKRMFSKVFSRVSQYQQLSSLQSRAFRASAIANSKKPSIGDAVTILQSKVSGINQVVSKINTAADALSSPKRLLKDAPAK